MAEKKVSLYFRIRGDFLAVAFLYRENENSSSPCMNKQVQLGSLIHNLY